jgi:cobalt/nickel transport system permease protein
MHMSDALISPAVGGGFWVVSTGAIAYAATRLRKESPAGAPAIAGVLAGFVFAAQMINFAVPGTGSSGHLGGGMLLAIVLGPWAGLIAVASVLMVQALFFADGGLLALGCNIFNLGVIPCLLVAPLLSVLFASGRDSHRPGLAGGVGAWIALMLGAFMVTIQTLLSEKTALPFSLFATAMLGIHAAIGVVEGVVTALVVAYVARGRAVLIAVLPESGSAAPRLAAVFMVIAIMLGTTVSWFASTRPDGLEWAIERIHGEAELAADEAGIAARLGRLQERTSFLPDYAFPASTEAEGGDESWPAVDAGRSLSGLSGALITISLVFVVAGLLMRRRPIAPTA